MNYSRLQKRELPITLIEAGAFLRVMIKYTVSKLLYGEDYRNEVVNAINALFFESLIVINALATKKIQIRGSSWSSIGKKVEKPLVDELCRRAGKI